MRAAKMVWMAMVLSMASATGCAIRSQAPIKEVAYDFSDADFYDRAYAPSPEYGPQAALQTARLPFAAVVIDVADLPPGEPVDAVDGAF
jgi:hypothetical protein